MTGVTGAELWVLKALPVVMVASAVMLITVQASWTILTPSFLTCNASDMTYANAVCQKKSATSIPQAGSNATNIVDLEAPNIEAMNVIYGLLSLSVTYFIALGWLEFMDVFQNCWRVKNYKEMTDDNLFNRFRIFCLSRVGLFVPLLLAVVMINIGFGTSVDGIPLVGLYQFNKMRGLFQSTPPVFCNFTVHQSGIIHNNNVECNVRYGPHIILSKIVLSFAQAIVNATFAFFIINIFPIRALFIANELSGKTVLALKGELENDDEETRPLN